MTAKKQAMEKQAAERPIRSLAKTAGALLLLLACLAAGCKTHTEFIPAPDGGMVIESTGQLSASYTRGDITAQIDSRKPSVLRNLIEFMGMKAAGTGVRVGE